MANDNQYIFDNWQRISRNNNTGLRDDSNPSEMDAWVFDNATGEISMPLNTSSLVGFISDRSSDRFTLAARLSSTSNDDDRIGLCIAHAQESNGDTHILTVMRSGHGEAPMVVEKDFRSGAANYLLIEAVMSGLQWTDGTVATEPVANGTYQPGWSLLTNGLLLRVTRAGDIITIETSLNDGNDYHEPATTVIDLAADPELHVFRGPHRYGFVNHSQPGAVSAITFMEAENAMGIFIDGFEQFLDGDAALVQLAGYTGTTQLGTATGRRPGSTALQVNSGTVTRLVPREDTPIFTAGVAARFGARGSSFFEVHTAAVYADPVSGHLVLNGVSGEVIPAADRFYFYEIEVDWANQQARLYVNGKLDITAPHTINAPDDVPVRLLAVTGPGSPAPIHPVAFDDLYIVGAPRLGPIEIATQMANQNTSPQDWEASVEDESHAAIVGAQPPDPLNRYVQSDEAGAVDRYNSSTQLSRDDEIRAVSVIALARVTRSTDQLLEVMSGSLTSTADPLDAAYSYRYTPIEYASGTMAQAVAEHTMAIVVGDPA